MRLMNFHHLQVRRFTIFLYLPKALFAHLRRTKKQSGIASETSLHKTSPTKRHPHHAGSGPSRRPVPPHARVISRFHSPAPGLASRLRSIVKTEKFQCSGSQLLKDGKTLQWRRASVCNKRLDPPLSVVGKKAWCSSTGYTTWMQCRSRSGNETIYLHHPTILTTR
jgi:hypothetical protein